MTYEEIIAKLKELGSEQTKKTFIRHGAKEPFFGVKVGDLKKLVKYVKKDHELALQLYRSGIHDAMYLAGLAVNPKLMIKEQLEEWAQKSYWYMTSEYTVSQVAAESDYALELARDWIESDIETIATCGWSTYSNYLSITPDEKLNLEEIQKLLSIIEETIHNEKNRVRYTMNNFIICVATYVQPLHDRALEVAEKIGKVHVNLGQTACKVPLATEYIMKVVERGKVGAKRKTCIC